MEEKARVAYIDIAAGIMIIWLLIYHALWPMYKSDVLCAVPFLFFFMPWFFYKSGYFFSPKALSETFKNDAIKLLKTYVVWSLIGYVCYILQHFFYYNSLSFTEIVYNPLRSLCFYGLIPLNTPLWFLPVLFMVHQLANLLCKCGNLLWIGIGCMLIAIALHLPHFKYMSRLVLATFWGLGFFCMGAWMRKYEQNRIVVIASAIVLIIAIVFTPIPTTYDRPDMIQWYWYICWYPACLAGCIVFNNICKMLESLHLSMILKWVGQNAIIFYVMHGIVVVMLQEWMCQRCIAWYDSWQGLILVLVSYIVVMVPLCFVLNMAKYGKNREK